MVNIRMSTFETNSSSAHTFVLRGVADYTTDKEIEEYINSVEECPSGYIPTASFNGDMEYGRGFEILNEWYNKMSYLLASFNSNTRMFDKIVDVVIERTGRKGVAYSKYDEQQYEENKEFPLYDNDWEDLEHMGSVDHQSYDCADNCITALRTMEKYKNMSTEEIIFEIIFCNSFVIIIDSDESYTFSTLYETNFFKDAGFKYILHEKWLEDESEKGYHSAPEFEDIIEPFDRLNKEDD